MCDVVLRLWVIQMKLKKAPLFHHNNSSVWIAWLPFISVLYESLGSSSLTLWSSRKHIWWLEALKEQSGPFTNKQKQCHLIYLLLVLERTSLDWGVSHQSAPQVQHTFSLLLVCLCVDLGIEPAALWRQRAEQVSLHLCVNSDTLVFPLARTSVLRQTRV